MPVPNENGTEEVTRAWHSLFPPSSPPSTGTHSQDLLQRLLKDYQEPHRHYHNLRHIAAMLRFVAAHPAGGQNEQVLDTLFHDVVYDPKSKTNEEDSAVRREEALDILAPEWAKPWTPRPPERDAILATKAHRSNNPVVQVVLDADLEVLSRTWDEYAVYAAAIRAEYAHVEDEAFRAGRAAVLQKFLERPQIYYTEQMRGGGEARARENLRREIALLREGGPLHVS